MNKKILVGIMLLIMLTNAMAIPQTDHKIEKDTIIISIDTGNSDCKTLTMVIVSSYKPIRWCTII